MINQGSGEVSTDADGWTIRAVDGRPSAHYEHMVVVQEEETEILSTFEYIEDVVQPPYELDALKENTTR
jgi:methionyl aminopeptidase